MTIPTSPRTTIATRLEVRLQMKRDPKCQDFTGGTDLKLCEMRWDGELYLELPQISTGLELRLHFRQKRREKPGECG